MTLSYDAVPELEIEAPPAQTSRTPRYVLLLLGTALVAGAALVALSSDSTVTTPQALNNAATAQLDWASDDETAATTQLSSRVRCYLGEGFGFQTFHYDSRYTKWRGCEYAKEQALKQLTTDVKTKREKCKEGHEKEKTAKSNANSERRVKGQENESRAKRDGKKDFWYEKSSKEVTVKGVVCSYSNMRKGITSELQEKRAHLSEKERAELQAKDKAKAAEEKVIKTETAQREKCLDGYKKEIAAKGKAPSKWAVCTYSDMRKGYTTELGAKHAQQVEDRRKKEEIQIKFETYRKERGIKYEKWKKENTEKMHERQKKADEEQMKFMSTEKYKKTMEKEEKEKMKKPDTMEKMHERQKKSDEKQMKFMSNKEREVKSGSGSVTYQNREMAPKVKIVKENSHKDTHVYTTRRV